MHSLRRAGGRDRSSYIQVTCRSCGGSGFGFVREFGRQMALSLGTSEISPISMFASSGATVGCDG